MESQGGLKRSLSFPLLVLYGLETTIGAGIYVLIGKVAGAAGVLAPVSFTGAGVIAGFTALSFAELSARFPKSAGEAVYVREGLNSNVLALIVGLLVIMAGTFSAAAIAVGAAGYILEFLDWHLSGVAIVLVAFLGLAAAWGVMESVGLACVFTLIEIAGLAMIIVVVGSGMPDISDRVADVQLSADGWAWNGVFAGIVLAFYAFIGFEDMVNVAEEVKDVRSILPRAIIVTLAITLVIYLLISGIAVLAVDTRELAESNAPLAYLFGKYGGSSLTITIIAIFATTNGALIQIIMASRVLYGLSAQGAIPAGIGRINQKTRTPIVATAMVTILVVILAGGFPIEQLAEATSVIALTIFTLVNIALICVKRRTDADYNGFRLPIAIPCLGVVTSASALIYEAVSLAGL
ncbi:MAG: amino acid permease [Rhodospirillaceae bacterium]|nr:amino acid permease [Rhodospirillaceae bacterium]